MVLVAPHFILGPLNIFETSQAREVEILCVGWHLERATCIIFLSARSVSGISIPTFLMFELPCLRTSSR